MRAMWSMRRNRGSAMRYRDKAVHARNPEVLVAGRRRLAIVAAVVLVV